MTNLFDALPDTTAGEVFDTLLQQGTLKIERIVSRGHTSPETGWYDQEQAEWVLVVRGAAVLTFADGTSVHLIPGGYLNIPAHTRHRVTWTDPAGETIWLAIFYDEVNNGVTGA